MHRPLVAFAALGLLASNAHARSTFPAEIPNGNTYSCNTCHTGTPSEDNLNVFGDQVHGVGLNENHMAVIWANIYDLDADGDGCSNGYELGDADGNWTPGAAVDAVQGEPGVAGDCTPPGGDGDGDGDVDAGLIGDGDGDGDAADAGPIGDGDGDGDTTGDGDATGDGDGDAVTGDGDGDDVAGDGDGDGDTVDAGCGSRQVEGARMPAAAFSLVLGMLLIARRRRR